MQSNSFSLKSKIISNTAIVLFVALVGVTSYLSIQFQHPTRNEHQIIEQAKLFNRKELEKIKRITLKNKSGEYIFERASDVQASAWHMISPKSLSVSSFFIDQLFSSLNVIKTKNLIPDSQLNNTNLSLNKPTATLTLTDDTEKNIVIHVGIMNTIDNSTYLKILGRAGIFHVEAPTISLENATLQDLIESRIFDFDFNRLIEFRILKKGLTQQFRVSLQSGVWITEDQRPLDASKLSDVLDDFNEMKSTFILDIQSEAQARQIQTLSKSADYTLDYTTLEGKKINYTISSIPKSLVDVDLKNELYFLITSSEGPLAYVVKQELLKQFELKNEVLKSLEIME